jgi:hypothetical protein
VQRAGEPHLKNVREPRFLLVPKISRVIPAMASELINIKLCAIGNLDAK